MYLLPLKYLTPISSKYLKTFAILLPDNFLVNAISTPKANKVGTPFITF